MALVEICMGMVAAFPADYFLYHNALGANLDWLRFIASVSAVLLTFLAGAELDPAAMEAKLREVTIVGLFGFFAPFLGCATLARFVHGWNGPAIIDYLNYSIAGLKLLAQVAQIMVLPSIYRHGIICQVLEIEIVSNTRYRANLYAKVRSQLSI
jgi:Kef-type K+ transport system membrane component KefB